DILRCTTDWYRQGPRRDCIIIESADGKPAFARLWHVLRCKLCNEQIVDIAAVTLFRPSRAWTPKTKWEGCEVLEERIDRFAFIALKDWVRGALLCPAFGSQNPNLHYAIDTVDEDMFVRLNNL
ncbi:hypothetical protein BKA62DRAFT_629929, partial [Auriculariales sp. MPI-PUGE-AT-0066]